MATGDPHCSIHGFTPCTCSPKVQDEFSQLQQLWQATPKEPELPASALVSGPFFDKILALFRKLGTCDRHQLDAMRREARSLLEEYKDEIEQYEKRKVHL